MMRNFPFLKQKKKAKDTQSARKADTPVPMAKKIDEEKEQRMSVSSSEMASVKGFMPEVDDRERSWRF
jgi:hypothetical protein